VPLWVSDALPGSTYDLTAAPEHILPRVRPCPKELPVLADSGYEGAGAGVPVKKPVARGPRPGHADPERAATIPVLRGRTQLRADVPAVADPAAGDAQSRSDRRRRWAALVLVQFEHKMVI